MQQRLQSARLLAIAAIVSTQSYLLCRLRYEPGTFVAHHAGWGSGKERYDRIADELQDPNVRSLF